MTGINVLIDVSDIPVLCWCGQQAVTAEAEVDWAGRTIAVVEVWCGGHQPVKGGA